MRHTNKVASLDLTPFSEKIEKWSKDYLGQSAFIARKKRA